MDRTDAVPRYADGTPRYRIHDDGEMAAWLRTEPARDPAAVHRHRLAEADEIARGSGPLCAPDGNRERYARAGRELRRDAIHDEYRRRADLKALAAAPRPRVPARPRQPRPRGRRTSASSSTSSSDPGGDSDPEPAAGHGEAVRA
jgi:hypothetical protein